MLHGAGLPKNLWGEAINFAVWLKNRTSTRVLGNVTPFERLYGEKPNLGGLPEWGQRVWVHNNTGSKLDARATEARWIGYDSDSTHAHRVYWLGKGSVSVERNIKFVPVTVTVFTPPPSFATPMGPVVAQSPVQPVVIQPSVSQPTITQLTTPARRLRTIVIPPRPMFTRPASTSSLPPALPPVSVPPPDSEEEVTDDEKEEEEGIPK